jgi:hypothetical protein
MLYILYILYMLCILYIYYIFIIFIIYIIYIILYILYYIYMIYIYIICYSKHSEVYITSAIWPKVRLLPQGYRAALHGSETWSCRERLGSCVQAACPGRELYNQEISAFAVWVGGLLHGDCGDTRARPLRRLLPGGDRADCRRWRAWRM